MISTIRNYKGILKDLDSEIDSLLAFGEDLRNNPSHHKATLEKMFKALKPLSKRSVTRAKFWSSLEQAYHNVIHCIDFPYYIIRNAVDVLLGEDFLATPKGIHLRELHKID